MGIIEFLFPIHCLNCKLEHHYLCPNCLNKVSYANTICPTCKRFSFFGRTHPQCQTRETLNGLVSLWNYEGVIRKAILNIKYKFATDISHELVKHSVTEIRKFKLPKDSTLVPIPLSRHKANWRGFNQTEILGKEIALSIGYQYLDTYLIKTMETTPQVKLNKAQRITNTKGKFLVNPQIKIKTKNIILFDDVWTTGGTLKEAARVIKKNYNGEIFGLTIACAI